MHDDGKKYILDCDSDLYGHAAGIYGILRLPPCNLSLRYDTVNERVEVYDPLRRKWVKLTPEEWVRQHFVVYMTGSLGYSVTRMANEVTLSLNNTGRRADTVVYDNALHPLLVVEYKAPDIALTNEVLEQALRYNSVLKAEGLMITNGNDVYSLLGEKFFRGVITAKML